MSPNNRVSSAGANNPIRIIFATCNHGRSAVKRATNSPSRSAARITARSIALATSRPGGRRPASIPLGSPATSGGKPGLMIRKSQTSRVSLRARRLDQLPRHLTVRRSRGPITVFHPLKAVQTLEAYASEQEADSARTNGSGHRFRHFEHQGLKSIVDTPRCQLFRMTGDVRITIEADRS